ncbi:MAG: ABC transporter substrate-binding protein [Candidatus Paceibacterota bacterium]
MKKRLFIEIIIVIVLLAAGACYIFFQQKSEKVYRIGILSGIELFYDIAEGFKQEMTNLGYIEDKNVIYDIVRLNADPEGEKAAIKRFLEEKVDLIFTVPTEPSLTAKDATKDIRTPIVFALATLEGVDLVNNTREPGGNITGVRYPAPELTAKKFKLLLEIVPQLKNLYIIYNVNYPATKIALEILEPLALELNVNLVKSPVTTVEELKAEIQKRDSLENTGIDAIFIMPEDIAQSPDGWKTISEFALKHKIPISGGAAFEAENGAIFSYVSDNIETGKLAAPLADKIFKGISPGTIPIVTPEAVLRVNYKTAQEMGLNLSEGFLEKADEIIR